MVERGRRAAEAGGLPGAEGGCEGSPFGGRVAALSADETAGAHGAGELLASGSAAVVAEREGESLGAGGMSAGERCVDEEELVAPRNEVEAKLAEIWRELLEVEQVGMEQNFFELGGHSLLVLQVTARIRRTFEVELPVRSVFEAPTIAGLAMEVAEGGSDGPEGTHPDSATPSAARA